MRNNALQVQIGRVTRGYTYKELFHKNAVMLA